MNSAHYILNFAVKGFLTELEFQELIRIIISVSNRKLFRNQALLQMSLIRGEFRKFDSQTEIVRSGSIYLKS